MLGWLWSRLKRASPLRQWSVRLVDGAIITSDGQATTRSLKVADLRKVVVATDDSGPWGADVMFLLYEDSSEPVGIFPLEAEGCDDFVGWLANQSGYRERELANAMGSTSVARFTVFEADPTAAD